MRIFQTVAGCVLVLAGTSLTTAQPFPAASESSHDSRWQPWLGCWELVEESERDEFRTMDSEGPSVGHVRVCITPAESRGAVRMMTSIDEQRSNEDVIVADGSAHPLQQGDCQGTRRAEWSRNGSRLFGHAELTCPGAKAHSVAHLVMLHRGFWLDILSVTRDGREGVRVRRYRGESDDAALSPAKTLPVNPFTIEDVKEASAKLTSLIVQAALVETNARFPLDGHTLIDLDKVGVPDEVTDLMVALSFPDKFKVDRQRSAGSGVGYTEFDVWGYAPFLYSYWGFNNFYDYPDFIVGDPGDGGSGGRPDGDGRVVNGRGYTRIEPREPESGSSRGHGASGSAASTADGSSSDSSGSASSSGYSSGSGGGSVSSGGGDSGRTAVPR